MLFFLIIIVCLSSDKSLVFCVPDRMYCPRLGQLFVASSHPSPPPYFHTIHLAEELCSGTHSSYHHVSFMINLFPAPLLPNPCMFASSQLVRIVRLFSSVRSPSPFVLSKNVAERQPIEAFLLSPSKNLSSVSGLEKDRRKKGLRCFFPPFP